MDFFTKFEELDACPAEISAFRVVNKFSSLSSLYAASGRENYALTFVTQGAFVYYFGGENNSSNCYFGENDVKIVGKESFECRAGELTFLRPGAIYQHRNPVPSSMYVLYFTISPEIEPKASEPLPPIHIKVGDPKHFEHLFVNAVNNFFSPKRSSMAVKSSLCTILSELAAEEKPGKLSEHELAMLSPAIAALENPGINGMSIPTVAHLARLCNLSEFTFRELFKRYAGITPKRFIDIRRIEQVESLLASEDITITDAALACGFNDPSYFFKLYKRIRGSTLGETR